MHKNFCSKVTFSVLLDMSKKITSFSLLNALKVKYLKFNVTFQLDFAKGTKQNFMAYSLAKILSNNGSRNIKHTVVIMWKLTTREQKTPLNIRNNLKKCRSNTWRDRAKYGYLKLLRTNWGLKKTSFLQSNDLKGKFILLLVIIT